MVKIVTSSTLKDSVIKSVLNEYEIKSKQITPEDLTYGGEVIEPPFNPFRLNLLREVSGLHDICITTKCEDAIYSGKKIISKDELSDANYLVVADTNKLLAMSTDWKNNYYLGSVEVTENDEVITTENSKIIWQIDENAGTITLNNSAAGYLYIEQSAKNEKNYYNIKLGDNTETNKFAYTVSEGVWVFSSTTYTDRQLEFYTKNAYWSYYTGQDAPIYLYKQQEGVIQKTYYSTTLDCSEGPSTALESEEVRVTARKMLINGQMYIVLGDRVYDITGQRVR